MIFRLSDMQRVAHEGRYAIPHFLGCTLEMTLGAIRAAEELNAPIAFGVAPEVFASVPLAYVFPMLLNAARQTSVPVAVQLEHGNGYAYSYENRLKWDSPLKYTVDMIRKNENGNGNNTVN